MLTHPGLDRLLDRPEDEWAETYDYGFGWWIAAGADRRARAAAIRDALAVVAAPPWPKLPGSLADLVGLPVEGGAPSATTR